MITQWLRKPGYHSHASLPGSRENIRARAKQVFVVTFIIIIIKIRFPLINVIFITFYYFYYFFRFRVSELHSR